MNLREIYYVLKVMTGSNEVRKCLFVSFFVV